MKIISAVLLSVTVIGVSAVQAEGSTKKFSSKQALCEYLKNKKEAAEDVMKKGYTASQYDKLEAKRKYWKKQYTDECF